ncbi:hypothetical protein EXIGLDRAFT_20761 [Exidia glandulosa HHB12029]|uniref:Uncharacterized protein n=1 Tax=Exidia glandulosa HHB12029 TaxID=1314781 RepID=A0A165QYK4_EXIGL|nr:hypothetical protein EXIGLDRAFT_20761 [Exidia glandulosa HHB12029]
MCLYLLLHPYRSESVLAVVRGTTACQRQFINNLKDYVEGDCNPAHFFDWEPSFDQLEITQSLFPHLVAHLPAFTNITFVTLVLDVPGVSIAHLEGSTLNCWKLDALRLEAREPRRVTAEEICAFACNCFRPNWPGLTLELRGPITLVGGPALVELAFMFCEVIRTP